MAQEFHGLNLQPAEIVERSVEALITKFPDSFRRVPDHDEETNGYATFSHLPDAVLLAVLKDDLAWQHFAKRLILRAWELSHALMIHFEGDFLNLVCLRPYQASSSFAEPVIGGYVAHGQSSESIYIYGMYSRRRDKVSNTYITETTFCQAENLELMIMMFSFEQGHLTSYDWYGKGEGGSIGGYFSFEGNPFKDALPLTSARFSAADQLLHDRLFR